MSGAAWADGLRSMEPRDHLFTVVPREVLHREVLPAYIRRAVSLKGEVVLCFPTSELERVETALTAALPELGRWKASGLVRVREGDSIAEALLNPNPSCLRLFRKEFAANYRAALVRGRTLWYAGGVGGCLVEAGHVAAALFGEMFVQNVHWAVPFAMLCPHYDPLDEATREGLEETHDGEL